MFDKKDKEKKLQLKVNEWWINLPYLKKLEILLSREDKREGFRGYPEFDISAIEHIGVRVIWNYNSLEKKALIMETYEKQWKKERN